MDLKKERTSQILNWHDTDIESRFGLPPGTSTNPGILGSLLFGSIMSGVVLGVLFLFRETPIGALFFNQGLFSVVWAWATLFFSSICLVAFFIKWRKIALQRKQFTIESLNELMDFMTHWDEMTQDHAREMLTGIRNVVDDPERFVMLNRLKKALSSFRFVGKPEEVAKILKTMAEEDDKRVRRGYRMITMTVIFIVIIGLAGTCWSVYQGLQPSVTPNDPGMNSSGVLNGSGGLAELVPTLLLGKGNPLDTLTLALMSAVLIQIAGGVLKRKDLLLLDACDDHCYTYITRSLPLSFGDRLEQIQFRIHRRTTTKSLDALWKALEDDPFMEEEDARIHLKSSIDKVRKQIKSRRGKRWIVNVMFVLMMASSVAFSFQLTRYRQIKDEMDIRLQSAFDQMDNTKAKLILDSMEASYRHLYTSAEIDALRLKVDHLEERQTVQKERFDRAVSQLESLRTNGFNASKEQVETLFGEARQYIGPITIPFEREGMAQEDDSGKEGLIFLGQEALSQLIDLERAWEEKRFGVTLETKERIRKIKSSLENELKKIGDIASPDLSSGMKVMTQMERLISEGEALPHLSPTMKRSLEAYRSRLNEIGEKWETRKRLLHQLAMSDSMEAYFKGLNGFVQAFPNDGINISIKTIKEMKPIYSQWITFPESSSLEMTKEGDVEWGKTGKEESPNPKEEKRADGANGSNQREANGSDQGEKDTPIPVNPFWDDLIELTTTFHQNMTLEKERALARIKEIETIHAFTTLWQCQVDRPNQPPETWYFLGEPTLTYVNGVKSYAGSAYVPSNEDVQPQFSQKDIISVQVRDLRKAPHCEVIAAMVDRIEKSPTLETLLREMHGIHRLGISPILELDLLKYIVKPLTILAGRENAGALSDMADLLEKSKLKHHWLCHTHPKYGTESQAATAIINDIFKKSNRVRDYMFKIKLATLALNRLPYWVGFADLERDEKIHLKPGVSPTEVWVLRQGEGSDANLKVFVTRERLQGASVISMSDHGAYLPGELLFAPQDDQTTWQRLHGLALDLEGIPGIMENTSWPAVWPVNVKKTPGNE